MATSRTSSSGWSTEHRHPYDNVRTPYDRTTTAPLSKLHALTILSAEQQVMFYYMNVGPQYMEPIARQLYQEISLIEQEHVTHYESLVDPGELAHLQQACDLLRRYDGREPEEIVGSTGLPEPIRFEPNKEYLRHLLATTIDVTTLGAGYVTEAHERFERMQEQLHGDEQPPSERVIELHRERFGDEYRIETEGPHPVEHLRERAEAGDRR